MKKIITIWWGNGQSNLLDAIQKYLPENMYHISSIVSMSDDGRTTWELMRKFQKELDLHLPPPGDLRRCLFMMSCSDRKNQFMQYLETIIQIDATISQLTIWDYFKLVGADDDFKKHLKKSTSLWKKILDFILPLHTSIKGHKVWNVLMANLYYNLDKNYNTMLEYMHQILEVHGNIIPVTTQKAYIRAILWNGDIIETQDQISNIASYTSGIADFELAEDSVHAYQHKNVSHVIEDADYIIITPWDIFTSIISNFVIGWVKECISKSNAKIIYIANICNKWGEMQWLTHLDIIYKIERFLGRRIDIFICNNQRLQLSPEEKQRFQSHISVKWWDYLYLSAGERSYLEAQEIEIYEDALVDITTLYKHNQKKLVKLLENILMH